MFMAVVGQAEGTDTRKTVRMVIDQCRTQLDGVSPVAGLLFAADHFDHALVVDQVLAAFPGMELAGCTSAGEMSSAMGFSQYSISLTLFAADAIHMAAGMAADLEHAPRRAARAAVADARSRLGSEPRVCLAFPSLLRSDTSHLLNALHEELGPECDIFGGFAGTDFNPDDVHLYGNNGAARDSVSILLMGGPIWISSIISNSWEPVGYTSEVTEVDGNRLRRIGGRTALDFFRHAFGPYAVPLPEMPLAVYDDEDRFYLRAAMDFDEAEGSINIQTSIPSGSRIQLTESTPDQIIANLDASFRTMLGQCRKEWVPQAGLLFSCASRRWIMGTRTGEELAVARAAFPPGIPISGFYTFGEIGALAKGRQPRLHNCTMVALLLGEAGNTVSRYTRPPAILRSPDEDDLPLTIHKLKRVRESQRRLEMQKESFTNVLRLMSRDLADANRRISQHNQILKESLTMAQEVQQSLLPRTQPEVDGFDVAGRSIYCDETGGDYLDYLRGPGGLSVVVGDVAGHGVAAALVMTTARALLRMRADMGGSPVEFVSDLNRMLTSDVNENGRFLTLFYLALDSATHTVTWVRAGHEPALRYDPETDAFSELKGDGLALGVVERFSFEQHTTPRLKPGEIVAAYTDGITEARNDNGEMYGRLRLKELIRANAQRQASEILDACFREIEEYRNGRPRVDDETLVIIKGR